MRPQFLLPVLTIGCLFIANAQSATVIDVEGVDGNERIVNRIISEGHWVRLSMDPENPQQEVYFNVPEQTLYIVQHEDKSIMKMTEQSLEQLGTQLKGAMTQIQDQMAAAMANMSEDQKAQMGNFLESMGIPQENAEPTEPVVTNFKSTGPVKTVGGIRCTVGNILENDQVTGTACVAQPGAFDVPEHDYANFESLFEFGARMADKMSNLFQTGESYPSFDTSNVDGLPIEMQQEDLHVILKSITQDDNFKLGLPEGYRIESSNMVSQ